MIYLQARSNGEPVALGESMALQIELLNDTKTEGYQVFQGNYDSLGEINWTAPTEVDNTLIPLPMEELRLKYYTAKKYAQSKGGEDFYVGSYIDSIDLARPAYADTYIATEAFEQRLLELCPRCWIWWEGHDK